MTLLQSIRLRDGRECALRHITTDLAEEYRVFQLAISAEAMYTVTQPHEVRELDRIREQIGTYVDQPGRVWLVVLDPTGQRVIADCMARAGDRERVAHVATIGVGVLRAFARQGIARAMMVAVTDWARRDPGVLKLELSLYAENLPAYRLYESLGFAVEGRRSRSFRFADGTLHDEVLMGRWVGDLESEAE